MDVVRKVGLIMAGMRHHAQSVISSMTGMCHGQKASFSMAGMVCGQKVNLSMFRLCCG
jgi:hypothetical protein